MKNLKILLTVFFLSFANFTEAANFTLRGASDPATAAIPTLSEWGIMILSLLLVSFGVYKMMNKRRMGLPLILLGFVIFL